MHSVIILCNWVWNCGMCAIFISRMCQGRLCSHPRTHPAHTLFPIFLSWLCVMFTNVQPNPSRLWMAPGVWMAPGIFPDLFAMRKVWDVRTFMSHELQIVWVFGGLFFFWLALPFSRYGKHDGKAWFFLSYSVVRVWHSWHESVLCAVGR